MRMQHFDCPLKCNDAYMDFGNTIQRNFIVKWASSGNSYSRGKKPTATTTNTTHINLRFYSCRHANEIVSYLYALFRIISILPFSLPPAIYRTRITELLNWIELQIGYLHSLHVTKYAHAHMNADWQYTEHFMPSSMVILLTNQKMSTNAVRINGIYVTRSNTF